ncbi:MAG: response regulator [Aureispira sp.]
MTKIILADDHEMLINSIQRLLNSKPEIEVIGKALNGKALLEQLQTQQPDLILLDINMPVMNGMEAAKKIKKLYPAIKILVVTTHIYQAKIKRIIELGVDGYVLKKSNEAELLHAIQNVIKGIKYYDPLVVDILMNGDEDTSLTSGIQLTERELEIIQLTAEGKTHREIGKILFLSPATIISHRKRIYTKLGVNGIIELINYANKHGLID